MHVLYAFTPSNYKKLLKDWITSKPNIVLARLQMVEMDGSNYLGSYISLGAPTLEVFSSKHMETLTSGMAHVGAARLPSWNRRELPNRSSEAIGDTAQCRCQ